MSMHPLAAEIAAGEHKGLEFKTQLPQRSQIAKTVIAFANTGGGKIVLGVDDQRQIIGLKDTDIFELQDRISSIIADSCSPALLPELYTVNLSGQLVLVIEVFRGSAPPYYLKKEGPEQGVYVRLGATTRRADRVQIQELERQRLNLSFDEEPSFEFELEVLDLSPLNARCADKQIVLDDAALLNLKLVVKAQGVLRPTQGLVHVLGLLDHTEIQCARFKGTDMSLFIDRKTYSGDLFSQLEAAEQFLWNHLPLRGEITGLQRTDTLEIPPVALREALVNAVVHRDYTRRGSNIKVAVFDDRVMILSPGALLHGLSTVDFKAGRSELRNRTLSRLFKKLGLIEQWGSGFQRMKEACESQGLLAPEICEDDTFFEVVFRRKKVSDSTTKVSEKEQQILIFLAAQKQITSAQVMDLTGLKEARARRILKEMCEKHLLVRQGKGRSTSYKINLKNGQNK